MILLRNVSLVSGNAFKQVNVVFDEQIRQIGNQAIDLDTITEEYDFKGCLIMPGAIDLHTHLITGQAGDKDILQQASAQAIQGGYTTLADMGYLSKKPIISSSVIDTLSSQIYKFSWCDMALWGFVDVSTFPYHIDQINSLWHKGIIGLVIMNPSPNPAIESMSYNEMMDLFDEIYDNDISFSFQGYNADPRQTDKADTSQMETLRLAAIQKILRRLQDNPVHFVNIRDKAIIEMLNVAYRRSDLSYSMAYATLLDYADTFNYSKGKDVVFSEFFKLICDSMKNSKLYTLSTEAGDVHFTGRMTEQHIFGSYDLKWLKWGLPLLLTKLWKNKYASLQSCIRLTSENPAKRLGLFPFKGALLKGSSADITIIDPEAKVLTELVDMDGNLFEASCSVKATFLRGKLIEPESGSQKPLGQFTKRQGSTRRRTGSTCWT